MVEEQKLNNVIKCAARALLKLAQQNRDLTLKVAQHEAHERALVVSQRLAENGVIGHEDVLTKAAALAKEDLQVVEKALDLNLASILDIGSAAMNKEAGRLDRGDISGTARGSFEQFLINTYG